MFRWSLWVSSNLQIPSFQVPIVSPDAHSGNKIKAVSFKIQLSFWCHSGFIHCYFDEHSGLETQNHAVHMVDNLEIDEILNPKIFDD